MERKPAALNACKDAQSDAKDSQYLIFYSQKEVSFESYTTSLSGSATGHN